MQKIKVGRVSLVLAEGDLRRICLDGVEVLRRLSYPVRDGGWGTHAVVTVEERFDERPDGFAYLRRFAERAGAFTGLFRADLAVTGDGAVLDMAVELDAPAPLAVNRAGFTLLHPLRGVAGEPLTVTHSDGRVEQARWPEAISPAQPVFDIAGLSHQVAGVRVDIAMTGEVFEMEDQRNWTDASYKTYCRPLGWPLPYALGPDAPVRQGVTLRLSGRGAAAVADGAATGVVPEVAVAVEAGLAPAVLAGFPVQVRMRPGDAVPAVTGPVHLECVLDEGAEAEGLARIANDCSGIAVARVVALTAPYLKSHQPEGPWPKGMTPMGLVPLLRAAFPQAAVGGGMLTNFTEFNRCRPDPALVDFATFSGTAIVHAADDLSVIETLEALPAVFATGRGVAGDKALHLGLYSIAMRSNPYAAECVPNPRGERLAMVRDDPRQGGRFAACFAAGVLAAASAGGVAALALAMTDGPLGAVEAGGVRPVYHVLRFAQRLRGAAARVETGDVVRIGTGKGGIVSVFAGEAVLAAGPRGWLMNEGSEAAARAAGWLETPARDLGGVRLGPMEMAFLEGGA